MHMVSIPYLRSVDTISIPLSSLVYSILFLDYNCYKVYNIEFFYLMCFFGLFVSS